ncbi:MAG TPA: tetratricopeptide repeat protein [Flavobacterium sp.]|uniref:tetratricopeptide repeat-containing sensor histidine kinase n=1 Tax=Flavobacterium sp. TaxID=239 RepID=UPI002CB7531E|nr:tetratricopeptide repeat protein [Flavobacterium sp.]HNP33635.1 tetratricopeptide repeat protein [Flavobacterium sp.]
MKRIIRLLLFCLLGLNFGFAQNAQQLIDKLKDELKSNPDAKRTATIYSDLTWYYSNVSTDSALLYGQKAISESTKLKDSTLIAQVNSDIGAVYFRRNDYENSKKYYNTALKIRKLRKDNLGAAKVKLNLANIFNKEDKRELALKYYLDGIDYFEKNNNPDVVSATKANVAILFIGLKNYPKAKKYLQEAISYQEKMNQDSGLCTSYLSMGNVYLRMKDTLNALKFYQKSMVSSKKAGNNMALSSALNNLGSIKSQQKKSKEAIALFNKSKVLRDSLNLTKDESGLSLGIAKEHIMYQRFDEANKVLYKLKKQYESDPNSQENLLQTYQFFIHTYGYLKEPDSVNYYNNLASKFQNTIIEKAVAKQTNELEAKYQSEKKEKQLLQKTIEIKSARSQLILVASIALFIGLIGLLVYRQQKLRNKQQQQEFELKSAIAKIETQNKLQDQRLQISRDLHDNIGSQLTFIISSVDNIKYAFELQNSKLDNKLSSISNFAKSTILELRDTIWAMNHSEITFEDLQTRIHNFVEKAKEAKQDVGFDFTIDENLKNLKFTSIEGMNIYRTIQEAVNNSIKYAEAKSIKIDIKHQDKNIVITIHDDGKGFDSNEIELGNGINNMKKRIADINGEIEIKSVLENGTTVQIKFPES